MKMYYTFKSKWGNLVTKQKEVNDENHMENFIAYLVKKNISVFDYGIIEPLKK